MTAGYDKRSRFTKRSRFRTERRSSSDGTITYQPRYGSVATVMEDVTSFRSDVIPSKRVPTETIDPYLHGFHRSPGGIADYFDPGRRLLAQMERSNLMTESDRVKGHSRGFIPDNGHPFIKNTTTVKTSARMAVYRIAGLSDLPQNYCYGENPAIGRMTVSTAKSPNLIFPLQGSSGDRQIAWFNQPLSLSDLDDDLADLGTVAITRCAPGQPEVSTTGILGELARDLPGFPGATLLRSLQLGSAGDEYLNLVFGLIPTLKDAQDLSKILMNYTVRLHQLRRDNGRPVRRKYAFPTSQKVDILSTTDGDLLPDENIWAGCGNGAYGFDMRREAGTYGTEQEMTRSYYAVGSLYMREVQRTWFKGSFTYILPEIPGFNGRIEKYAVEMDRLLGLDLDPSVAWQLTPWSWLVDWFIDISAQMDVLSVNYDKNLVLNYGYAMQETERSIVGRVEYSKGTLTARKAMSLHFLATKLVTSRQRRIRANPYGFVLQTDGEFWSAYRLAVLGALGLSRL